MKDIFDKMQLELLEFVKRKHGEQKRKYTGDPYWTHVVAVAEIVDPYEPEGIEAALCHDLFEDTACNFAILHKELVRIGYERRDAYKICTTVTELSDVYTHEDFPYYNREKRKEFEAERLGTVSYLAQSIKYADLIHNTESIVEHDKDFAKKYLQEKDRILELMIDGNPALFKRCMKSLQESQMKIR
jgi:(p)ppGpp synthase/HD superfamily hydrolase